MTCQEQTLKTSSINIILSITYTYIKSKALRGTTSPTIVGLGSKLVIKAHPPTLIFTQLT